MQSGERYGKLVLIERAGNLWGGPAWSCRCDCGRTCVANGREMRRGRVVSCGCSRARNHTKHGHCKDGVESPTYKVWQGLVQRTTNPGSQYYARCGGRGIVMDPNWATFARFLADMGERPEGAALKKSDPDAPYSKASCRWVVRKSKAQPGE